MIENHRDVKWFTYTFLSRDFVSHTDVLSGFWSLSFSGFAASLYQSLLGGATLLLIDPKKVGGARLVELMRSNKLTYLSIGPPLFRIIDAADRVRDGFPEIRFARFGASGAARSDIEAFFKWAPNATLRHSFGMSEIKHVCSYLITPDVDLPEDGVPIGYEVAGVEILLVDDDDNPVAAGEVGEMIIKSSFICPGYWNSPELNSEKIWGDDNGGEERFLRTGDLGMRDDNGCLFHRGRKDFQVKIRGYRVELDEIESVLRQAPGVADAAAIADSVENSDDQLVAFFVPDESFDSVADIRRHIANLLPAYMIPTKFVELTEIPSTQSDKVDRKQLSKMTNKATSVMNPTPSEIERKTMTDVEQKLARIWTDALQRESVGVDEDFFEIGGDSLMAAVLFDQLYRVFGKRVPINTLFEAPTVAEQARYIEALEGVSTPIVPIRPSGSETPIFCFHSLGGSVLGYYALARHLPEEYPVWAVQPKGTDGAEVPIDNIPEMAKYYCDEITRVHSEGPFILTGISLGGEIAFEVARELSARGREVHRLVLIDTATPVPQSVSIPFKIWDGAKKTRQALVYAMTNRRRGRLSPQQARGRIYQNNIRAARNYRNSAPEPVDLPTSLIRAVYRNQYHMPPEAVTEWQRLVVGIESVFEVDGAHYGEDYVLDEPNVAAVGDAFLTAITAERS